MQIDRQYHHLVGIGAPCNTVCVFLRFFVSIPSPVTLPDVLGSSAVPSQASLCRLSLPPPSNAGHGSSSHLAGVATSPSKYTRRRSCVRERRCGQDRAQVAAGDIGRNFSWLQPTEVRIRHLARCCGVSKLCAMGSTTKTLRNSRDVWVLMEAPLETNSGDLFSTRDQRRLSCRTMHLFCIAFCTCYWLSRALQRYDAHGQHETLGHCNVIGARPLSTFLHMDELGCLPFL